MLRRTPPERVVVNLCVNGNGASRAIHESVADTSLQLCAVSLTENLWAWQAHKDDKSAGKRCNWIPTGRSRRSQRGSYRDLQTDFGKFSFFQSKKIGNFLDCLANSSKRLETFSLTNQTVEKDWKLFHLQTKQWKKIGNFFTYKPNS